MSGQPASPERKAVQSLVELLIGNYILVEQFGVYMAKIVWMHSGDTTDLTVPFAVEHQSACRSTTMLV